MIIKRLTLSFAVLVFSLLAAEGILSLFFARSMLMVAGLRASSPVRVEMLDEERMKAAALTEGPFAMEIDPFIGTKLKANFKYKFMSAFGSTDAFGQRVRIGPEPATARREL
ncbi:MAG: hypothetical protein ACKVS6_10030 [Planctomycetota bacterium]